MRKGTAKREGKGKLGGKGGRRRVQAVEEQSSGFARLTLKRRPWPVGKRPTDDVLPPHAAEHKPSLRDRDKKEEKKRDWVGLR